MPQRYRNSSLADNPYVGINVDYFDKKAMEKQQRHDVSRENYSKFVQDVANQPFLDADARDQYLKEQQKNFDEVISKYSGNLSSGYQDILGAIEKSKLSPYHNLNKRQVEQELIRQDLTSKYGAEAIDLSNMPNKLYQRDEKGNINWINPNDIGAKVVKADDYGKIIEDMLKETAAHEYQTQSGISGGSGNPFYLMSRIVKGEVLSPEELMQISSNPDVQKAFLANASTSGIDNRKVSGTDYTYKEMFQDPNKLAHYIYGNIQDKQRNNQFESKQFMQNVSAVEGMKHANKKKEIAYEQNLKNYYLNGLTSLGDVGPITINKESLNKQKENHELVKQELLQTGDAIKNNTKKFTEVTGIPTSNLSLYTDQFGNLNKKLVADMMKRYGKDENQIVNTLSDLDQLIKQNNDVLTERNKLNYRVKENEDYFNKVDNDLTNKFFSTLSKEDKDLLQKNGITSLEDLTKKTNEFEKTSLVDLPVIGKVKFDVVNPFNKDNWKDVFKKVDYNQLKQSEDLSNIYTKLARFKDEELSKGTDLSYMIKGQFNADPNSVQGQYDKLYKNVADKQGVHAFLNNLQDRTGNNYLVNNSKLKEFLDDHPNLSSEDMKFIMPANTAVDGVSPLIKIFGKDDKGKPDGTEFTIVDGKLSNENGIFDEINSRLVHNQIMTHSFDPNYDKRELNRAYYLSGSSGYSEQAVPLIEQLKDAPVNTSKSIPFTYKNGTPGYITFTKTPFGFKSDVNGRISQHSSADNLLDLTYPIIGSDLELVNNPNVPTNFNFYPESAHKGKSVNSNLDKSKGQREPLEGNVNIGESEEE